MYGWTFAEIAQMTPYQQLAALSDGNSDAGIMNFRTEEDYIRWLANRKA